MVWKIRLLSWQRHLVTQESCYGRVADVPGAEIIVFLSRMSVSKVQELQMTTQTGDNTHVIAIDGNFGDAQTNVKHMFNDVALREKKVGYQ